MGARESATSADRTDWTSSNSSPRVSVIAHERVQAGDDLAHALLAARTRTADDPVAHTTSLAFLPLAAA